MSLLQFITTWASCVFLLAAHPIHISRTEVHLNSDSKRAEITMHIFIDDLELGVIESGGPDLGLTSSREVDNADYFIMKYLEQHFVLTAGDSVIPMTWVGKEQSDDYLAFWCYIESDPLPEADSLQVKYAVLQEVYDDQKNILVIEDFQGREHHALCTNRKNVHQMPIFR